VRALAPLVRRIFWVEVSESSIADPKGALLIRGENFAQYLFLLGERADIPELRWTMEAGSMVSGNGPMVQWPLALKVLYSLRGLPLDVWQWARRNAL